MSRPQGGKVSSCGRSPASREGVGGLQLAMLWQKIGWELWSILQVNTGVVWNDRLGCGELTLVDVYGWGQAARLGGHDVPGSWTSSKVVRLQWGARTHRTLVLVLPGLAQTDLLDRVVDAIFILGVWIYGCWLARYIH